MAFADAPEQHGFAEAIVRRLCKGAGARNRAAAVVEPVADDMPARNVVHPGPPIGCDAADYSRCALAGRAPRVGEHCPHATTSAIGGRLQTTGGPGARVGFEAWIGIGGHLAA